MKKVIIYASVIALSAMSVFAQKGVDTQTNKIKQDTSKTTQIDRDSGRGFNFGKDKTKTREMLANPYRLTSRRDLLIETIINTLKDKKLLVDDAASKLSEGIIITAPYVFAKGAVITKNELNRYAIVPESETVWRSGRYSLRIDVESIDGMQNNVSVSARIDGKAENGFTSEWTTLQSSGLAEDEFLAKLVEAVTGQSPDEPQTTEEKPAEKPKK